jgi:hypothetical protein
MLRDVGWTLALREEIPYPLYETERMIPNDINRDKFAYFPNSPDRFSVSETPFEIFPNPATDYLTISCSEHIPLAASILIQNSTGFIEKEIKLTNPAAKFEVDISDLPSGFYIVIFTQNSTMTIANKFIKF